jgi:hypothetical protein
MEPISYERQLAIILWANPDLADKDAGLCNGDGAMPRWASWYEFIPEAGLRKNFTRHLPPLYVWDKDRNWVPNLQWFFTEAVPRLTTDGCYIAYGNPSCFDNKSAIWYVSHEGQKTHAGLDPIAALAEYVEAK